jgi:hypothetical protein
MLLKKEGSSDGIVRGVAEEKWGMRFSKSFGCRHDDL